MGITFSTTIHPYVNNQPSLLYTPKVPRRPPRKRALSEPDKFEVFTNRDKVKDFTSFTSEHTPFCYDFKRFDDRVQYYNLCFTTESGAPAVRESMTLVYMSLCLMMDMLFHYLSGSAMDKIAPSQGSACLKILHRI